MKTGVLTSSRADYGVYLPLLRSVSSDPEFNLNILAFGTHLSKKFGNTVKIIESDGFYISNRVKSLVDGDLPEDITNSMAKTMAGFSKVWSENKFDLIFALGDRYEMFAAVASSVPFNIPVAHLHGGETTLGAIDNVFRHSISSMSKIHLTAAEDYKNRVAEITGSTDNVYNVGALSIEAIQNLDLLSIGQFYSKYDVDLSRPTILVTFHPETVDIEKNEFYVNELIHAMDELEKYQLVITMPNSDTKGLLIRQKLINFIQKSKNVYGFESLGSLGYLSCMKNCKLMLGNSSSGFIEAAYFQKPVVNLGNRQMGRIMTPNIFNCIIQKEAILNCISTAEKYNSTRQISTYGDGNVSKKIIEILKKYMRG